MGEVLPLEYSIGTVASLTGLDAHTIRAWERRYGAVEPNRSDSGRRRYDDRDVERLRLLRSVTEAGHAIGQVARRSNEDLRELLSRHAPAAASRAPGRLRVALHAPELARQVEANLGSSSWEIVSPAGWDGSQVLTDDVDVVVAELHELGDEPWVRVEALRKAASGALIVVLYRFARHAVLSRLARLGCRAVRGPVRLPALERSVEEWLQADRDLPQRAPELAPAPPQTDEVPERRFDDAQLARLLESPGSIACECPSHLSALVSSTLAFEAYMEECKIASPEDSALHDRLRLGAGRIRSDLERLLEHLCIEDGIRI